MIRQVPQRILISSIAASCLIFILQACAMIERTVRGIPFIQDGNDSATQSSLKPALPGLEPTILQLNLSGLDLSINSSLKRRENVSFGPFVVIPLPIIPWPPGIFKWYPEPDLPLWIELEFLVNDPIAKSVSFDPLKSSIQAAKGPLLQPSQMIIGETCTGLFRVQDLPTKDRVIQKPFPVSVNRRMCIQLAFMTSPNPDRTFTLKLDGLTKDEIPVSVPIIIFSPKESYGFNGMIL